MNDQAHPLYRPAARALVIDDRDRVLLFRTDIAEQPIWLTPGGGLEHGESYEAAARRELWEETGLRLDIGPCVWVRRHIVAIKGFWIDETERIYVARTGAADVTHDNWVVGDYMMTDHRWWSVDEIRASDHWFAPRNIASFLPAIIAGHYPCDPVDCGV